MRLTSVKNLHLLVQSYKVGFHCLFVLNLIYFIVDEFTDFDLDLEIEALSSGSSDESASEVENTDCSALGTWTDTATENADNCSLGSVLTAIN